MHRTADIHDAFCAMTADHMFCQLFHAVFIVELDGHRVFLDNVYGNMRLSFQGRNNFKYFPERGFASHGSRHGDNPVKCLQVRQVIDHAFFSLTGGQRNVHISHTVEYADINPVSGAGFCQSGCEMLLIFSLNTGHQYGNSLAAHDRLFLPGRMIGRDQCSGVFCFTFYHVKCSETSKICLYLQ